MDNVVEKIKEYGKLSQEYVNRATSARDAFLNGYNCTQAVLSAFSDKINTPIEDILKIAQPLGGGISRLREICGSVSGGALVLGALFGSSNYKDYDAKKEVYRYTQLLGKRFEELNGSVVCRDLLGLTTKSSGAAPEKRTEAYYKKRPCADLVWISALLVAQIVEENGITL